jgi:hypothetical protein
MRVPRPDLLKLTKESLLEDVRERLGEKYPDYKEETEYDATDPAWVILEQAAWLVELLSEQLDRYPYNMVQEFVHMMGGAIHPSLPSIGFVTVEPAESGTMENAPLRPAPWRFFTLQTEELDMIEFVPVEGSVSLIPASIESVTEVVGGELFVSGKAKGESGIQAQEAWRTSGVPSRVFDGEWIRYDLLAANAEDLMETLKEAIEALSKRKIGWLEFDVEMNSTESVSLYARINLDLPFLEFQPGGLSDGTDVRGHWGTLDDSNWTPPVVVSSSSMLPPRLRGSKPLPGLRRGTIVIPNVPKNFNTGSLLERLSMPIPTSVVEAIWTTLTHMDQKLANYTPSTSRGVEEVEEKLEPTWISSAIDGGNWSDLVNFSEQRFVHVRLLENQEYLEKDQLLRVGLIYKGANEENLPNVDFYSIDSEGVISKNPLHSRTVWRIKLPDPMGGQRMVINVAYDITIDNAQSLLLCTSGNPISVVVNCLLVANTPAVNDGRELEIQRNIPEPINLLYDDVVNDDVIGHLLADNIPSDTAKHLQKMPLSKFSVSGSADVLNFKGMYLDPTSVVGEGALLRVNAPDNKGEQRQLRPGKIITFDWYRRTDGHFGNVPFGSIQVIEQPPRTKPLILSVHNPLATFFGSDRESELEAIDRMFHAGGSVPITSTDWERIIRVSLGVRGRGWVVRCWSYAERSLISTRLWPLETEDVQLERENIRLERDLDSAGPETLYVVIGQSSEILSEGDLDWARGIVQGLVRRNKHRLPIITSCIVSKFTPLTLFKSANIDADIVMPSFTIEDMKQGIIRDPSGQEAVFPGESGRLLLNAAIIKIEDDLSGLKGPLLE